MSSQSIARFYDIIKDLPADDLSSLCSAIKSMQSEKATAQEKQKLNQLDLYDVSNQLDDIGAYLYPVKVLLCHLVEFVDYLNYNPYSKDEQEKQRALELCANAPTINASLSFLIDRISDVIKMIEKQSEQLHEERLKIRKGKPGEAA